VILKIFFGEALDVAIMSALGVKPENSGTSSGFSTRDSKLNPILDGRVSSHAHSPDVTCFNVMCHVSSGVGLVNDGDGSRCTHFESFTVGSILFGFLSHKSDIRNVSHGLYIKLSVFNTVLEDG